MNRQNQPRNPAKGLLTLAGRLEGWLLDAALPLWWNHGADHVRGGFEELLGPDGLPVRNAPRRARVQARQSYVYAVAGAFGWSGPWHEAAQHGLDFLTGRYLRNDGQFCTLVSADGAVLDDSTLLYDQAFVLLAAAAVHKALPNRQGLKTSAHDLLGRLIYARRHPAGGFVESSERKFQSNPHMHLLEAALAWRAIEPGTVWDALSDEIAMLCLTRFIDSGGGFLREFFDGDWRPLAGPGGCIVEPGHQFEWAWLLERWGRLSGHDGARAAARGLFGAGVRGVDPERDVAVDEMSDDFSVTRASARLWPQTERLKAAIILSETEEGEAKKEYLGHALGAAAALWQYLETPTAGLWRDKMLADGSFIDEPAPASSFYHIVCSIMSLKQTLGAA